ESIPKCTIAAASEKARRSGPLVRKSANLPTLAPKVKTSGQRERQTKRQHAPFGNGRDGSGRSTQPGNRHIVNPYRTAAGLARKANLDCVRTCRGYETCSTECVRAWRDCARDWRTGAKRNRGRIWRPFPIEIGRNDVAGAGNGG